jgi:hypothetical protein
MSRDPKIVVADHLAFRLQFGANRSIVVGRFFRSGQRRKELDKVPQSLQSQRSVGALLAAPYGSSP